MRSPLASRVAAFALLAASARAHEIGTTRVTVAFHPEGAYAVEIVTDAAALSGKLAATRQDLAARIRLVFDAGEVRPAAIARSGDTIRLTGPIPPGARTFQWSYGWTFASYALTAGGETQWLEGGELSRPIPLRRPSATITRWATARRYLSLGFTHIVPLGLDHVLFVLGIWLLGRRARAVLAQVSAFTLAHSITLGLSLYGVVSLPPRIVEPLIAVSIAYVAVENLFLSEVRSRRVALVFAFGLLHGLGFAGALREIGLPRADFLTALLAFNLGVEAGQLAVIAAAFLLLGRRWADRSWYRARVVIPASALIACVAVYWTIQRL